MQFETSVSTTSTPSLVGRPPMPPETMSLRPNCLPVAGSTPPKETTLILPLFAAGSRSGSALTRAPKTTSAIRFSVWARIATGYRRDELQTGDHMHTDGFGGKSAGQKGGTSPEDGPNGHRTLACVTTWMETCHPSRETSHHTVDETASVYSYFFLRYRNTLSAGESREETNPTFAYNNASSQSSRFSIESCR